jgi:ketosteroid isomerase-like protein
MPEDNVDLVRRGYEAWNSGDIDAVLSLVDPDIEWGVEVKGGVDAHVWTIRDGNVVAVTLYQGTTDALRELER